ncbi:hypothetical protein GF361_00760 [Candidatus Woesearchaeota archaeon]|nr:hypothetical protein [Candidatus Woesearchaeota archaeon]
MKKEGEKKRKKRKKSKKLLLDILKGVLLVVVIWYIDTFIAFVPFSRQSNTRHILMTWFIVDTVFVSLLVRFKKINWRVGASSLGFIFLLVGMYFLPINSNIPQNALMINNNLSEQYSENKYDYAKALFFEVEKKYTSPIRQYLLEPWKVFIIKDFEYFWNQPDDSYADSNIQGRIYRKLLLKSGRFTSEEVIIHQSFCSNSPHLLVKINYPERGTPIWADLWAVDNFPGVESNKTYEFGMRTIRPCDDLIGKGY